jgi:hypothetical protein
LDGELLLLLIGVVIGILGSILGYALNHLLTIREGRIVRDFEIREKGRKFFHQTYGVVALLSDLVRSVLDNEDSDKATVLTEEGYDLLRKEDIVKTYKDEYDKHSEFGYNVREKGLEVFLTKELADYMGKFWAYAGYFYSLDNWNNETENMRKFQSISQEILDTMDRMLGLNEKIPKWLNPKKWRRILRSGKLD